MSVINISQKGLKKIILPSDCNQADLITLLCDQNGIIKISGLSNCFALQKVSLSYNRIVRVSGLTHLKSLTYLDLSHNSIVSIDGLEKLTALKYLNVNTNSITDVSPIHHTVNAEHLDLSHNCIRVLTDLSPLRQLQVLHLEGNIIRTIQNWRSLLPLSLLQLSLGGNQLQSLDELEELDSLLHLEEVTLYDNHFNTDDVLEYTTRLVSILPSLKSLDSEPINQHTTGEFSMDISVPSPPQEIVTIDANESHSTITDISNEKADESLSDFESENSLLVSESVYLPLNLLSKSPQKINHVRNFANELLNTSSETNGSDKENENVSVGVLKRIDFCKELENNISDELKNKYDVVDSFKCSPLILQSDGLSDEVEISNESFGHLFSYIDIDKPSRKSQGLHQTKAHRKNIKIKDNSSYTTGDNSSIQINNSLQSSHTEMRVIPNECKDSKEQSKYEAYDARPVKSLDNATQEMMMSAYNVPRTTPEMVAQSLNVPVTNTSNVLNVEMTSTNASVSSRNVMTSYNVPVRSVSSVISSFNVPVSTRSSMMSSYNVPFNSRLSVMSSHNVPISSRKPMTSSISVPVNTQSVVSSSYDVLLTASELPTQPDKLKAVNQIYNKNEQDFEEKLKHLSNSNIPVAKQHNPQTTENISSIPSLSSIPGIPNIPLYSQSSQEQHTSQNKELNNAEIFSQSTDMFNPLYTTSNTKLALLDMGFQGDTATNFSNNIKAADQNSNNLAEKRTSHIPRLSHHHMLENRGSLTLIRDIAHNRRQAHCTSKLMPDVHSHHRSETKVKTIWQPSSVEKQNHCATLIQAVWRGYHTRNLNARVLSIRCELRTSRLEDHIVVLKAELQQMKILYEEEKKMRKLQLEAIWHLWREVQMLTQRNAVVPPKANDKVTSTHMSSNPEEGAYSSSPIGLATSANIPLPNEIPLPSSQQHSNHTIHDVTADPPAIECRVSTGSASTITESHNAHLEQLCHQLQNQVAFLTTTVEELKKSKQNAPCHKPVDNNCGHEIDVQVVSSFDDAGGTVHSLNYMYWGRVPHSLTPYTSDEEELYFSQVPNPGCPTPPRSLTVTHRCQDSVVLTWDASKVLDEDNSQDLLGYRIYLNDCPKGMVPPTKCSALVEGLDTNLSYKLYVRAVSLMGESFDSDICVTAFRLSSMLPNSDAKSAKTETDTDDVDPSAVSKHRKKRTKKLNAESRDSGLYTSPKVVKRIHSQPSDSRNVSESFFRNTKKSHESSQFKDIAEPGAVGGDIEGDLNEIIEVLSNSQTFVEQCDLFSRDNSVEPESKDNLSVRQRRRTWSKKNSGGDNFNIACENNNNSNAVLYKRKLKTNVEDLNQNDNCDNFETKTYIHNENDETKNESDDEMSEEPKCILQSPSSDVSSVEPAEGSTADAEGSGTSVISDNSFESDKMPLEENVAKSCRKAGKKSEKSVRFNVNVRRSSSAGKVDGLKFKQKSVNSADNNNVKNVTQIFKKVSDLSEPNISDKHLSKDRSSPLRKHWSVENLRSNNFSGDDKDVRSVNADTIKLNLEQVAVKPIIDGRNRVGGKVKVSEANSKEDGKTKRISVVSFLDSTRTFINENGEPVDVTTAAETDLKNVAKITMCERNVPDALEASIRVKNQTEKDCVIEGKPPTPDRRISPTERVKRVSPEQNISGKQINFSDKDKNKQNFVSKLVQKLQNFSKVQGETSVASKSSVKSTKSDKASHQRLFSGILPKSPKDFAKNFPEGVLPTKEVMKSRSRTNSEGDTADETTTEDDANVQSDSATLRSLKKTSVRRSTSFSNMIVVCPPSGPTHSPIIKDIRKSPGQLIPSGGVKRHGSVTGILPSKNQDKKQTSEKSDSESRPSTSDNDVHAKRSLPAPTPMESSGQPIFRARSRSPSPNAIYQPVLSVNQLQRLKTPPST